MSKPTYYTARELAEALLTYGDMKVGTSVVNADDEVDGPHLRIRLEITHFGAGNVVSLTGYAPAWGDPSDDEDDEDN